MSEEAINQQIIDGLTQKKEVVALESGDYFCWQYDNYTSLTEKFVGQRAKDFEKFCRKEFEERVRGKKK